jgi:hypothetical protein
MRPTFPTASKFFQIVALIVTTIDLLSCGRVELRAGDREDAKALVGKWTSPGKLQSDFELTADGKYIRSGESLPWTVKSGKIILSPGTRDEVSLGEFKLSPDQKTLTIEFYIYKRK